MGSLQGSFGFQGDCGANAINILGMKWIEGGKRQMFFTLAINDDL